MKLTNFFVENKKNYNQIQLYDSILLHFCLNLKLIFFQFLNVIHSFNRIINENKRSNCQVNKFISNLNEIK